MYDVVSSSIMAEKRGHCECGKKESSPRVGLVHEGDFARYSGPLEFAAKRFVASLTLVLFPLE